MSSSNFSWTHTCRFDKGTFAIVRGATCEPGGRQSANEEFRIAYATVLPTGGRLVYRGELADTQLASLSINGDITAADFVDLVEQAPVRVAQSIELDHHGRADCATITWAYPSALLKIMAPRDYTATVPRLLTLSICIRREDSSAPAPARLILAEA
jgi:hypothetical protein